VASVGDERRDERAGLPLVDAQVVQSRQAWPTEPAERAFDPSLGINLPIEVAEAIGQRSRQVPAVGRFLRRVGRGNDRDSVGQPQIAHRGLEDDP
jgi:hypothetical protein